MTRAELDEMLRTVEFTDLLADEDSGLLLDAFVVVRYIAPTWQSPGIAFDGTAGLTDESLRLGLVAQVYDRIKVQSRAQWEQ